jgi:3-hydroxyisobutyrate dehydrogenase-like beta-hydroxyacid dehydrogenase
LTVYDRSEKKTKALEKAGAAVAASPRKLASLCDVIMSCVTNDKAIEAVMLGADGALNGAKPGSIFIDLSTVYPATSRRIFEAAKTKGINMLDATVSGSTPQAEQGALVVMVGGENSTFQRCRTILSVIGKEVTYIGSSGSGAIMKLAVNTLLGLGLQAVAEAIALGEKAGLDREVLLDMLGATAVISPAHRMKLHNARSREYPATFPVRLMHKDFGLIMRLAAELSVPMPATAAAFQMCSAENAKNKDEDYSATIRLMEELSVA